MYHQDNGYGNTTYQRGQGNPLRKTTKPANLVQINYNTWKCLHTINMSHYNYPDAFRSFNCHLRIHIRRKSVSFGPFWHLADGGKEEDPSFPQIPPHVHLNVPCPQLTSLYLLITFTRWETSGFKPGFATY